VSKSQRGVARSDVVITSEPPAAALEVQLQHLLRRSTPITLLPAVIGVLQERRAHAETIGPWVERSYRL
jgi:hypothetical protein